MLMFIRLHNRALKNTQEHSDEFSIPEMITNTDMALADVAMLVRPNALTRYWSELILLMA